MELSFGEPQLAAKLMVGDYVCREECDIWMEDDSGYRPSSEPENHTVYRTGGIAASWMLFLQKQKKERYLKIKHHFVGEKKDETDTYTR